MQGVDTTGRPEFIHFNGVEFRRMGGARSYYLSQFKSNHERKTKAVGLHVAIFKFYSGKKIPKGFHVHHKDGDPFNNAFENLECIPVKEHAKKTRRDIAKMSANLERIRPLATAWHQSKQGREWHRKHAISGWKNRQLVALVCVECQEPFTSYFSTALVCSTRCGNRRRPAPKLHTKICSICSAEFYVTNKTTKTCSNPCRTKAQRITVLANAWVDFKCPQCATSKRVRRCQFRKKKYCSQKCAASARWARMRLQH